MGRTKQTARKSTGGYPQKKAAAAKMAAKMANKAESPSKSPSRSAVLKSPSKSSKKSPSRSAVLKSPSKSPKKSPAKPFSKSPAKRDSPEKGGPYKVKGSKQTFWEVEEVLESKNIDGKVHYLVKWVGYGHESNTWEPKSSLRLAPDALREFKDKQK